MKHIDLIGEFTIYGLALWVTASFFGSIVYHCAFSIIPSPFVLCIFAFALLPGILQGLANGFALGLLTDLCFARLTDNQYQIAMLLTSLTVTAAASYYLIASGYLSLLFFDSFASHVLPTLIMFGASILCSQHMAKWHLKYNPRARYIPPQMSETPHE
jgi:hypothetical protein